MLDRIGVPMQDLLPIREDQDNDKYISPVKEAIKSQTGTLDKTGWSQHTQLLWKERKQLAIDTENIEKE